MTTGHDRKSAGIARTLGNPRNAAFKAAYIPFAEAFIVKLRVGSFYQMEDIKAEYLRRSLPTPVSSAWGGVTVGIFNRMRVAGYIRYSHHEPSSQPGNHAHPYAVYERI